VAGLTIAAALLRFATIDVQSYWFDEALTAKLVSSPFGDMLHDIPRSELTPPLYYVLAWPWAHVFGRMEVELRAFSALFGIGLVPVAYLLGRELATRAVGIAIAALVAFNPLLVYYSQEARPYSLFVLLCTLSLLFFVRALRRGGDRELWLWAGASAAALLTHYFAAFIVVPAGLWLAWRWSPRRRALIAAGAVGAVGAALIPLALYERSKIGTGYISGFPFGRRLIGVPEDYLTGFVVKFDTPKEKLLDGLALAVGAVGLWLAFTRTSARERSAALLAGTAVVCAAGVPALLAVFGADFLNTRNVIAGAVPALLVLAVGFAASRTPRVVGIAGVVALCAIGVASVAVVAADETFHKENWRGIAERLGPPSGPRAIVVPPASGELGLELQIGGLSRVPASGAAVSEVAVVTPRSTRLGGPQSGRPAQPQPPRAGFRLAEKRYAETYTLLRWVAPRPVQVSLAELSASGRGVVGAPVPLLQRPPGG
jgi:4-amino-4-deoxy-L-arabinose transferase-like glycosyltransferase